MVSSVYRNGKDEKQVRVIGELSELKFYKELMGIVYGVRD